MALGLEDVLDHFAHSTLTAGALRNLMGGVFDLI